MKKGNILCLLIGVLLIVPVAAQTGKTKKENSGENESWNFRNFGLNTNGKLVIDKNKMSISTKNTYHCFFESDSYSFAYQSQKFLYDDCSRSTISVKIDRFPVGSAGIMMRSGERLDAANAHLEVSAGGDLLLFFRKADGVATSYRRLVKLEFPVEIKLVRQGNMFIGFYKNESGEWIKGTAVIAEIGEDPLVGLYACSGNESQIGYSIDTEREMQVSFSKWSVDYEENYIPEEKNYVEKIPLKEGTLLRENFNDGSMSNGPESIGNPVWKGIKFAELPYDANGGRYWKKRGDGIYYLGDKKWADYEVNIDLSFDATVQPSNEFMMQLRYQHISVYEKLIRYYGVGFRNGNTLFFEKYDADKVETLKSVNVSNYLDGSKHNLKVRFLDKKYQVYYDGNLIIDGVDEKRPITYGNMGIRFTNVFMNIYELELLKVDDPVNGNEDNYLLDYFDRPIPAYLKQYGYLKDNND